jgi:hypothetical protein
MQGKYQERTARKGKGKVNQLFNEVKVKMAVNGKTGKNGGIPFSKKNGFGHISKRNNPLGLTTHELRQMRYLTEGLMDALGDFGKNGKTKAHSMLTNIATRAANGDPVAQALCFDRIEGKATQAHVHSGEVSTTNKHLVINMTLDEMADVYADTLKQISSDKKNSGG